jgi:hypothetical protein
MKIIISEEQLRQIIESENKKKLLSVSADLFYDKWKVILDNYKKKGFDGIKLIDDVNFYDIKSIDLMVSINEIFEHIIEVDSDLDLKETRIKSLGNLEYVVGNLDLEETPIKSLGNLEYVGGRLDLTNTTINDFGNLKYVGDNLRVSDCPLDELSDNEIRSQVEIKGVIIRF